MYANVNTKLELTVEEGRLARERLQRELDAAKKEATRQREELRQGRKLVSCTLMYSSSVLDPHYFDADLDPSKIVRRIQCISIRGG